MEHRPDSQGRYKDLKFNFENCMLTIFSVLSCDIKRDEYEFLKLKW